MNISKNIRSNVMNVPKNERMRSKLLCKLIKMVEKRKSEKKHLTNGIFCVKIGAKFSERRNAMKNFAGLMMMRTPMRMCTMCSFCRADFSGRVSA